ncbi:MAG: hypothetical protein K0R41_829 [Geminicoccaceae bacterium]|jgi:hypothetical protein|nr:hypothetical protein [Geminicoccaceae bacterium]MCE3247004.1 hypothetical protein [Geminicoccaceae bacterium]MDF2766276.1 hypothetical protein [Rhodospirillales bacterium]
MAGNGFMLRLERGLRCRDPTAATKPVDNAPPSDRDEPGAERPAWIVGVAHSVECQEDVLHDVVGLAGQGAVPRCQRAKIGRDVLEQAPISGPVAILRARHQRRPRRGVVRLVAGCVDLAALRHVLRFVALAPGGSWRAAPENATPSP